jgi:iron complex outermembrane recepter protein
MIIQKKKALLAASIGAALSGALPIGIRVANAQANAALLEEIVVTARRREENLQEVPTAISAFTTEDLRDRNIEQVADLSGVVPNFSVAGNVVFGEASANFRARGLPGIAVYVDGVWQNSGDGLFAMDVVEVQRIEVLRGPQGTLFGQAAQAGAVNYVTVPPGDEFDLRMTATVGELNRKDLRAALDIPIGENFKTKFTLSSENREGFLRSVVIDHDYGDINDDVFRGDFLWDPTENFSARFNVESSKSERNGPARALFEITAPQFFPAFNYNTNANAQAYINIGIPWTEANFATGPRGQRLGEYGTAIGLKTAGQLVDQERAALDVNWDINDKLRFRSISGTRDVTRESLTDFDGTAQIDLLERDFRRHGKETTQEFQLLGTAGKVDWVVGAFYYEDDNQNRIWTWNLPEMTCDLWAGANTPRRLTLNAAELNSCATLRTQAIAGGQGVTANTFALAASQNGDVLPWGLIEGDAVFADLTWRITDKMTASFGYRTADQESTTSLGIPVVLAPVYPDTVPAGDVYAYGANVFPPSTVKFDGETTRASLQYQVDDDLMVYASYADGFQPGGNGLIDPATYGCAQDVPWGPYTWLGEDVTNFEVGLRADWADGRVRTNVTVFTIDWKNPQVQKYVSTYFANVPNPCNPAGAAAAPIDRNADGQNDLLYFPNLFTSNAGKAEIQGLEFESIFAPTSQLRLNLNLGLLDTAYTELGNAGTAGTVTNRVGVVASIAVGTPFQQAPEYTLNLGLQYRFERPGGASWTPRFDYTLTDDYMLVNDVPNQRLQEGFGLLNARLTYDSGDTWQIAFFGTNLTDEWYLNSGFYIPSEQLHTGTIGRPREVGASFTFFVR